MTNPKPLQISAFFESITDEFDDGHHGAFGTVRLRVAEGDKKIYDRSIFYPLSSADERYFALMQLCIEMNLQRLESAIDQL